MLQVDTERIRKEICLLVSVSIIPILIKLSGGIF
jgi:hypothetical protein